MRGFPFKLVPLFALLAMTTPGISSAGEFKPGEVWLDTEGNPIQAHGGGILVRGNTYYWYGEDRTPGGPGGVACYSSTNLQDWKREGLVLSHPTLREATSGRTFIERPKVIFNDRTGKHVMWFHAEQRGYHYARAGIAISDTPAGQFEFLDAIRPVQFDFGYKEDDPDQQAEFGGTFRDMNLFVDDDGRAYVLYASEHNATLYVVRLNEEFTGPELPMVKGETWERVLVGKYREAPAPFKHNGRYHLITSGCTGWAPNAADHAVADNILGPWKQKGNPCVGQESELTFHSQSTFVLPVQGRSGAFIFMADRWKPRELSDSRNIWLPFEVKDDDSIAIQWRDSWDLSVFDTE